MTTFPEYEAAVIGSMILDGKRIDEFVPIVSEADFADGHCRELFTILVDMHKSGAPIDSAPLVKSLRDSGRLDQVGGAAAIGELAGLALPITRPTTRQRFDPTRFSDVCDKHLLRRRSELQAEMRRRGSYLTLLTGDC